MRALALLAVCLLSGCYSMARTRHDLVITARESQDAIVFHVWADPGWVEEPAWGTALIVPFLYPYDFIISFSESIDAMNSPTADVRWGPLGAIAAILLPYVTLFPDMDSSKYGPPYGTGLRVLPAESMAAVRTAARTPPAELERALRAVPDLWHEKWVSAHFVEIRARTEAEERDINR